MKILYNGDISPMRIRVLNSYFYNWKKGEIRDIDVHTAKKLLKNNQFSKVDSKKEEEIKEKKSTKDVFDLDNNGVRNGKDKSIAGKVLRAKF